MAHKLYKINKILKKFKKVFQILKKYVIIC